jgi:hypothetical protein
MGKPIAAQRDIVLVQGHTQPMKIAVEVFFGEEARLRLWPRTARSRPRC